MDAEPAAEITYDDFAKVDMRLGVIIEVEEFPKARNPSYKVKVDFGPVLGVRQSSLQAKTAYALEEMLNKRVIAVVNFPKKNIAGFLSEILILGVPNGKGGIALLTPDYDIPLGGRVY